MDAQQIYRRAGGRRKYNASRQRAAAYRREVIRDVLMSGEVDESVPGLQRDIARALGVSRSTVCRDFAALGLSQRRHSAENGQEKAG